MPKTTLKEKFDASLAYWNRNVVTDPNAPEYYSELTIYCFSLFCSTLFGSFLIAYDLYKINKKVQWKIIFFGIGYFVLSMFAIDKLKDSSGASILLFNILGVYILNRFFWNTYVGEETKYRAKPFWKPLILALCIDTILIYAIAVGTSANNQIVLENTVRQKNIEIISQIDQVQFAFQAVTVNEVYGDKQGWTDLISTTNEAQNKINDIKKFLIKNVSGLENSEEKNEIASYIMLTTLEEPLNQKMIELAQYELTIDWDHPTKDQINQTNDLIQEIKSITNDIDKFRNTLPMR